MLFYTPLLLLHKTSLSYALRPPAKLFHSLKSNLADESLFVKQNLKNYRTFFGQLEPILAAAGANLDRTGFKWENRRRMRNPKGKVKNGKGPFCVTFTGWTQITDKDIA